MTGSQVDLIADGLPSVLAGQIELAAGRGLRRPRARRAGAALALRVRLHIDTQTGAVTGTLDAAPVGVAR